MWIMWITRWITLFPSVFTVDKVVENLKSYPQKICPMWISRVIHKLSTRYPHRYVDNISNLTLPIIFSYKRKVCFTKICSIKVRFFIDISTILCLKLSFPHYPQLTLFDDLF